MLLWFSVAGGAVGTFMKGDFGEFCRALGVFALLLVQRTSFTRFLVKFVSQVRTTLYWLILVCDGRTLVFL